MRQLTLDQKDASPFEAVISMTQLRVAYAAVRANKGAAGIDGVSVEAYGKDLDRELTNLAEEVREWRYRPRPVKRVRIP